ncbi:MAG: HPr family phosphocarrier protein [Proteobacteria bacterium]|uniref:HPr family phosphocarrier protein n=1 Tax=Candidatus Avisuccinivibrio stercorigallinarum TaxID=2840704 RepID=A0A9D9GT67_9GAMM|nr:HPr family phosphocarrier protein [Candidatus Avisuccinivibrio stercorigallinarum]
MQQFIYTIKDRDGVHARPAGVIIQAAHKFKSDIALKAKGKQISLKGGIFSLMGLGIRCGDEIEVVCTGEDETEAAAAMRQSFEQNL